MARVLSRAGSEYSIRTFLGLNEAADGDTTLKEGEAAVMRNFRITPQGHLQTRGGYAPLCTLQEGSAVQGLWSGYVDGRQVFLAACAGKLWKINPQTASCVSVGAIPDAPTHFFGFGGKVYILTGAGYHCWDGAGEVTEVEGYIPLVVTACPPEGGGTLLERVNLLTGKKRARFSPDGTATVFRLPEGNIGEVLAVEGTDIGWSADTMAGTVTFESAPAEGVSTVTVTWRKGYGNRGKVEGMTFAETYNGATDARVFLYGDGTNESVYSDLDGNGVPSAEYFPDMNIIAVDSANTPITAMVRHYDRLMVYKTDSAHCVEYSTLTLDTGEVTAGFTCRAVNRAIGNTAMGQSVLVENSPVTLFGQGVYGWSLSSAGSRDERNAKLISARAAVTLGGFDLPQCVTFDDEAGQELYIVYAENAVIYNYGNDTWYTYTNFPARCMARAQGGLYFGTQDGRIMHLSRTYRTDDGAAVDAYWESGSVDMGVPYRRKWAGRLWVAMKPCVGGYVQAALRGDSGESADLTPIACALAGLDKVDFARFSFNTARGPRVFRRRIRARRFTFCKLTFTCARPDSAATVLGADIRFTAGGEQG